MSDSGSDRYKVLVVDDESAICRALEITLRRSGYRVATAASARDALVLARLVLPEIVLLDLVLPDGDGVAVCSELRQWTSVPIVLLSVVDDEREKVRAFDAGADDYITKPFGVDELLARMRALLRRADGEVSYGRQVVSRSGVSIDLGRHVAHAGDQQLHLTPTEFRVLRELVRARGGVVTHELLLRLALGPGHADDTPALRVNIVRLRDKLEAAGIGRGTVETVAGVGYRIRDLDRSGATTT